MTAPAICPVCGAVVSTYEVKQDVEPIGYLVPTRVVYTERHVQLVPCGCRLRWDETFAAYYTPDEVLIRVVGEECTA